MAKKAVLNQMSTQNFPKEEGNWELAFFGGMVSR
jgi:hypothetical protein